MTVQQPTDAAVLRLRKTSRRVAHTRARGPAEPDWSAAICHQVDPELWFPEKGGTSQPARRICQNCPIQKGCLEYALSFDANPTGIWGGTTERERRKIRDQRRVRPTRQLSIEPVRRSHDHDELVAAYEALPKEERATQQRAARALRVSATTLRDALRARRLAEAS